MYTIVLYNRSNGVFWITEHATRDKEGGFIPCGWMGNEMIFERGPVF